jgi:hypothetical protein
MLPRKNTEPMFRHRERRFRRLAKDTFLDTFLDTTYTYASQPSHSA